MKMAGYVELGESWEIKFSQSVVFYNCNWMSITKKLGSVKGKKRIKWDLNNPEYNVGTL